MRNPVLRNLCREIADNLIGLSPTIRVENEFYFERGSETIVVSGKKLDDEFEVMIDNFFTKFLGVKLNPFLVGFLHELGHFWTKRVYKLDNEFFEKEMEEKSIIEAMSKFEIKSYEEILEEYYKVSSERMANDFIKLVLKSKPEVVKKYNSIFNEIDAESRY